MLILSVAESLGGEITALLNSESILLNYHLLFLNFSSFFTLENRTYKA
jgi:hypothetical protein